MSRSTSSRLARKSALAAVALVVAVGGLAGCSSDGGSCPEGFLELVAEQQGEGAAPRVVPASEFPVEELRSSLQGACIVASSIAPGDSGEFYMAVAPEGVSGESFADATTAAGFEWSDVGDAKPYGTYIRVADPSHPELSEYLFLQEVDSAFIESVGANFGEGQVAMFYQEVEIAED